MLKRKNTLIIVAVLLQCIALAAICFQREIILHSGNVVYMRTAPVDPRDLFRGDYVRLNYEASTIPKNLITDDLWDKIKSENCVYVIYETDDRNVMIPKKLSVNKPPATEKYIRAYTTGKMSWDAFLRYGIEKYFMEQGKGRTLEKGKTLKGIHIPLEMEVAIGKGNGIAVLKGYRYADLGMNIVTPKRKDENENKSFCITLKIVNASNKPLSIIQPEDNRTFEIEILSNRNEKEPIEISAPENISMFYTQSDIKIIAPESVYDVKIDLSNSGYKLHKGGKEISWNDFFAGYQNARIKYVSPSPEKLEGLKGAESLWKGVIYSRNFTRYDLSN
ncbi:MAG: GDYXXLXY domain-containing protein [Proteobacteria bacterium]|nr:GDYXXLXY domain-containing protein [Pseudomonadota bacterium]